MFLGVFRTVIHMSEQFSEVIKIWIGPKLTVFLADPRDVEIILSSQVLIDKSSEYEFFKPWLGDGLLISSGKLLNNNIHLYADMTWLFFAT